MKPAVLWGGYPQNKWIQSPKQWSAFIEHLLCVRLCLPGGPPGWPYEVRSIIISTLEKRKMSPRELAQYLMSRYVVTSAFSSQQFADEWTVDTRTADPTEFSGANINHTFNKQNEDQQLLRVPQVHFQAREWRISQSTVFQPTKAGGKHHEKPSGIYWADLTWSICSFLHYLCLCAPVCMYDFHNDPSKSVWRSQLYRQGN